MQTILEIRNKTAAYFEKCGVPNPRYDAELLMAHSLGVPRMQLFLNFDKPLSEAELSKLRPLVARRGKREPLQYILGESSFRGHRILCDTRALIPRPETEVLVDICIQQMSLQNNQGLRILDVGTGTGAIICALALECPQHQFYASDISQSALDLASENFQQLKIMDIVYPHKSDLLAQIPQDLSFDLIVSNPPYIPESQKGLLQAEVGQFEPESALFSKNNGLQHALDLIQQASTRLNPQGKLLLELGEGHGEALMVMNLALKFQSLHADLSGVKRFVQFSAK